MLFVHLVSFTSAPPLLVATLAHDMIVEVIAPFVDLAAVIARVDRRELTIADGTSAPWMRFLDMRM